MVPIKDTIPDTVKGFLLDLNVVNFIQVIKAKFL